MAKPKLEDADYIKIGKTVEGMFLKDYVDFLGSTKRQLWSGFIRGIATGFGGIIGATLLVALLVWLLSIFGQLPNVGHIFTDISQSLSSSPATPQQ